MEKLALYERCRVVPEEAKKPITAGRLKGFTDINPMWRIKKLTEEFGPAGFGWYYKVIGKQIETVGQEVLVFVDIELYVKMNDEWSAPIHGSGGSKLATKEKNGVYVSDECYKMAITDALSVACKLLGIGADVYFSSDRSKYTSTPDNRSETKEDAIQKRLKPVIAELERIGYGQKAICKTYKINSIYEMSAPQIKDFLSKAKNVPNKEPIPEPCPEVPADIPETDVLCGLPFN